MHVSPHEAAYGEADSSSTRTPAQSPIPSPTTQVVLKHKMKLVMEPSVA